MNIKDIPHELGHDNAFLSNNLFIGNNGSSGSLIDKSQNKKPNSNAEVKFFYFF